MKLTKRLVAVALAILMIFGSFSAALTATAAGNGTTLGITTRFFRNVNGAWIETDKVVAGEEVKLGVYIDTDYYTGDGSILLYYNNTFFDKATDSNFAIGSYYQAGTVYDISGNAHIGADSQASSVNNAMLKNEKVTQEYLNTHEPIYITYTYGKSAKSRMFNGEKLFCEMLFKVKAAPTETTGLVEALESTAASTSFQRGRINIPKSEETESGVGGYPEMAVPMWNWNADLVFAENPVSLYTNCTSASFDANGGKFAVTIGTATKYDNKLYSQGEAGTEISKLITSESKVIDSLPVPTKDGYAFKGWKVSGAEDATASEVTVYPAVNTDYVAVWERDDNVGSNVTFRTEFYRQNESGEWVYTEKVKPGENVKARLFIDTDYSAGDGQILFFYDGDFFDTQYKAEDGNLVEKYPVDTPVTINVNDSETSVTGANNIIAKTQKASLSNRTIQELIKRDYITADYLANHPAMFMTYQFPSTAACQVFSGDEWFAEFDLRVKDNAIGEGDFFVLYDTICNTEDGYLAYTSVGKEDESSNQADHASHMANWAMPEDISCESNPVSVENTITFKANGGQFAAEDTETYVIGGTVGAKVDYSTIPEISRSGWTFMGWIDASDETPTREEAKFADQLPATMTYNSDKNSDTALVYNAFWVNEVNITFANINPETEIAEVKGTKTVTVGADFVAPEDPTIDGYRFVGWTTEWDEENGILGNITGLPATYPATSTTYYAVFSAKTYPVNYYVIDADIENPTLDDFKLVGVANVEYNTVVPAVPHGYNAPEGYVISVAYTDVSYADQIVFADPNKLVVGTKMPAHAIDLYYKIERAEFNAVFDAKEGTWADGDTTKTVPAVYGDEIVLPEEPIRAGYVFAGWTPSATIMDAEGKTFEATWTPDVFTATYYVDGVQYEAYRVEYADDMEIPADPYKEGYEFLGWAAEEGSNDIAVLPATMPAEDVNYYAVFEVNEYTIKFANTGDTTIDDITLPYGTDIPEVADPEREGYTFKGWAETSGASEDDKVELPATMPATPAEGKTYYAIWAVKQYNVTWIVDGTETTETYDFGEPIEKPTNPSKTGYTFSGWTPAFPEEGKLMPAEDLTYTAVFAPKTYNAVFLTKAETETHDGAFADDSTSATVPTKFNEAIVAPAENPTRTGYTFAGWTPVVDVMDEEGKTFTAMWTPNADTNYSVQFYMMNTSGTYELKDTVTMKGESDSVIDYKVVAPEHFTIDAATSTYDDGVIISPDGLTVITVYFKRDSFNIVFDGNDGTVNGEDSITTMYYYGSTVAVPVASRVGYTFAGWTDNSGNALDVNLTAVEAVTYYAKWEINQYTITFENTGDSVIAPITQNYATEIVAPQDPTRLGYEFADWDIEIPETMPANDMTITAEWNVLSFDAVFNPNGGVFEDNEPLKTVEDITFGEDVTAPTDVPSKEGYTFNGWLDADGNPVGKMDDEGKEYFADWKIKRITITFAETGDSVIAPIIQDYATAVEAPADPKKEGYTFKEWSPSIPETMPAEDMVITATWEPNEYTITFENTGDSVVAPIVQAYNSEVTAPDDPEKVGYDFAGWDPTVPSTMPLGGTTVTAMWVPKTDTAYKVVVNYTDAATGVHADEYDYAGTTDNAIAIVDAIPEPEAENTEYVLMSDLAITGYVLDTEADNELTGVVAADGSTVLNIYYIPVKVKATFDADGGAFYDQTTSKEAELDYNALVSPVAPKGYDAPTKEGYTFGGWQGLSDSTRLQAARTFKAIWTPNTYKITWILDGVTQAPVSYEYNALIAKQTPPTKAGYRFVGWVDENGKAFDVPNNMPAKDLTIATKYEVLNYNVVWNDGTNSTTESKEFGSAIVEPSYKPVKEGYTFGGWKTADGKTPAQVATVPVDGVEFNAQWTKNSHKVYYYVLNPATGKFGSAVANADVLYDAVIPTEFSGYTAPTGYSLVNVAYTDSDLTSTLAENAKMGDSDINLYYELAAKSYNAVFKANGGSWADEEDGEKTVSAAYNSTINAPVAPQYEGYEFIGWTPAVDKMDSEGKTFVAQWRAKTYTVTYKSNGGVWGEDESIETSKTFDVAFGATVTAPESNPVRTGYTFGGWNETVPATMPAQNLVFTAKWTIKTATITFMDGTSTIDTVSGSYGTAVTAPTDPQKEGYTFNGWDTTVPATMPENDMTINAVWSKNAYDIVWDVDGVKTIVKDVPYGNTITKAPNPVKTGYEFKGWTGYTDGMTMPARDVTFTAVFEPKTYTVTFDANGGTWENNQSKKTVTAAYGTALAAPDAPTKAGYTFQTWSPTVPATMPADNVTYTAIWATAGKVDYTVETYLMNTEGTYTGVTPISTGGTATIDAYITVPIVAPAGFTFDSDATGNYTEGVVSGDGTTVFKIYYERNSYTVKFVGNGGTIDGNTEKSGTYYYGTTVAEPVAVKTGYEFAGWADAAENGNAVAVEVTVLGSATYYAQWKAATYTATFKAYPGAFGNGETTETTEFTYGTAITEPANAPLRDGYTFDEWTDADGKTPDDYGTAYAGDATFTAKWVAKYYDAKFYTDNTKAETHDTKNAQYNTSYNVPTDPEKTGYEFIGWYDCATDKSAGLPEAGGLTQMPLNGAEYYAVWEVKEYNLVYRANNGAYSGGLPSMTYTVPFGTAKADMPAPESAPVRTGYTFNGYSPELPETMPAEQYNLVAQWSKNSYDVTFNAGVGSFESTGNSTETATVPFEDYVYAPEEEPVRAGYDFGGWKDADGNIYNSGDEIGTMGADDMTFEAVWSAKEDVPYTVKHYFMNVNGNYEGVAPEVENLHGETDTTATAVQKTRDNFTFDSDASTVSGTITADGALVLELYYVREKNAFTIYDEDGNVLETSDVYFEAPISVEAPTKEGYDFDGWKDEEGVAVGELTTMPGDKLDIYESWKIKSYNAIFDANEGAWADEDTTKTVSVQYDSAITAPEINPVRAGHTFKGWFDAKENGKSLSEYAKMPASALTFYARWEANKNDYRIEIYEMNPDGTMPEDPTSMVINNALVNENVEANVTVPAGFTLDTDSSVLSGVVPATGTLVLKVVLVRAPHKFTAIVDGVAIVDKVEYYYDQTVEQIAVPTKNGFTFLGWSTVKDSTTVNAVYPARMPNNDVTIYGVWSTDAYNATFDAGEGLFESTNMSTTVVPVEYGEDIVAPTEAPTREGFVFGGWKDSHGTIYQAGDVVGIMSNSDVKYEAVWNKSSFTVTFYGYEALDASPYKSANASVVLDSSEYDYRDVITFPEEADFPENAKLNTEYYTFIGWSKTENGTVLTSSELYAQTMPAEDTAYYAVYERVKVMLVPNSDDAYWKDSGTGCTTVIDRAGGTVDDYDATTSRWYVYGLTDRMQINARFDEKRLDTYIDVSGDGYYEVVEFKVKEGSVGTGTVINVYDNLTGELVESFWIIIYGDLDGDGIIANNDYTIALTEHAGLTSWSAVDGDEYIHYYTKAADLNGNDYFNFTDAVQIDYYVNGIVAIDQATGIAYGS